MIHRGVDLGAPRARPGHFHGKGPCFQHDVEGKADLGRWRGSKVRSLTLRGVSAYGRQDQGDVRALFEAIIQVGYGMRLCAARRGPGRHEDAVRDRLPAVNLRDHLGDDGSRLGKALGNVQGQRA